MPERPAPAPPPAGRAVGGACAGLLLFAVLAFALRASDPSRQAAGALVAAASGALLLAAFLPRTERSLRERTVDFCRGAAAYLCVLPGATAVNALNRRLAGGGEPAVPEALIALGRGDVDFRFWLVLATIAGAAPCFEEFFVRGLLQPWAAGEFGRRFAPATARAAAIVFASLVFTALHEPAYYLPVFVLSLVLGVVAARRGGVAAAIGFHAAHNLYAVAYERWLKAWFVSVVA